ncbi:hypothetical protein RU09_11555 [Microbacterium sp. MEJ108Y]|uniref:hypothetical protein n=1 Tax=Microbacterium sp. MEJ108Y TaxID=1587523 RepID=UPI0005AC87DD|nr:hypothetical protein [Microbacterium sp. MEJ108Y]KIP90366.1 hypothetical protein RU09_11555 [Microbacterium sp. MEJ108Y]
MEPVPTDFWGVVVPSWLGAVASIAASTVAVIAFINSLSAKGGVREIGEALNREPTAQREADVSVGVRLSATATVGPEPWAFDSDGKVGTFRNTSGQLLVVSGIASTGGIALTLRDQLPLDVPPTASFQVRLHQILGGPAVRGVTIEWVREDGELLSRTYYL